MKLKSKRVHLPTSPLEAAAIEWCEQGWHKCASRVEKKVSIADLEDMLLERLRRDEMEITAKAIEAAENDNDEIADRCLRQVFREKADAPGDVMSASLRAFGIRAIARAPVTRGPGARNWYADWKRNILIGTLLQLACLQFGLHKSRNRLARRAGHPSGASIVAAALRRCGVEISERRIEAIYDGLAGILAEGLLACFSKP
jgi:hypothetical protein